MEAVTGWDWFRVYNKIDAVSGWWAGAAPLFPHQSCDPVFVHLTVFIWKWSQSVSEQLNANVTAITLTVFPQLLIFVTAFKHLNSQRQDNRFGQLCSVAIETENEQNAGLGCILFFPAVSSSCWQPLFIYLFIFKRKGVVERERDRKEE